MNGLGPAQIWFAPQPVLHLGTSGCTRVRLPHALRVHRCALAACNHGRGEAEVERWAEGQGGEEDEQEGQGEGEREGEEWEGGPCKAASAHMPSAAWGAAVQALAQGAAGR